MSSAYERHGNDSRWIDVRCSGCGKWLREEFDGDMYDLCEACHTKARYKQIKAEEEREQARRKCNISKKMYEAAGETCEVGFLICPNTLKPLVIGDVGDDYVGNAGRGAFCYTCNKIHYEDDGFDL